MADETELERYVASIASGTAEMIAVTDALKDALVAVLQNEEDCAIAIVSAKETRDALIRDTYRVGLMPFMQPAAAEETAAEEGEEETADGDEGDEDGAKGGRGRR